MVFTIAFSLDCVLVVWFFFFTIIMTKTTTTTMMMYVVIVVRCVRVNVFVRVEVVRMHNYSSIYTDRRDGRIAPARFGKNDKRVEPSQRNYQQ